MRNVSLSPPMVPRGVRVRGQRLMDSSPAVDSVKDSYRKGSWRKKCPRILYDELEIEDSLETQVFPNIKKTAHFL